jgi:hypothetical protein
MEKGAEDNFEGGQEDETDNGEGTRQIFPE